MMLLAPVGTWEERIAKKFWPGAWVDVNPYGNRYMNPSTGRNSYHTGADLNLNKPHWDADRLAPVYAIAMGVVSFSGFLEVWGNVIVIRHVVADAVFYARYAHVVQSMVRAGTLVTSQTLIAKIGQDALKGPYHLHFDISLTEVLAKKPWDWPGEDLKRLQRDYIDPLQFLRSMNG